MTQERKTGEVRDKELRLAISRIEKGRAHTQATKLTIAAVAREAGVSTALIHNCHPEIAEIIREAQGRSSRAHRDAKHQELKAEREKSRLLREDIATLRDQVAKLASINEVILAENREFKSRRDNINLVDLASKNAHSGQSHHR
jgi:AcrR family transcriptional regulator